MNLEKYGSVYLMPVNALSLAIVAKYGGGAEITLLDNNENCDGHSFRGVSVVSPKLHDIPTDATAIVCSFLSGKAMTYQLQKSGVREVLQYGNILSAGDYEALVETFIGITEDELRAVSPQHTGLIEVGPLRIRNALRATESSIVVNAVNLVPTLRCTLKCRDCSALDPFSVIVSDYGELSRHRDVLIELLHSYGIKTAVLENLTWYDFARLVDLEGRSEAEIDETYKMCSMMCAGLVKNQFSKCFVALLFELLGSFPDDAYGERSVLELTTATREELQKHLNSDVPMQACAVCSGKSRLAKQIPPAIQADCPMTYKRYRGGV